MVYGRSASAVLLWTRDLHGAGYRGLVLARLLAKGGMSVKRLRVPGATVPSRSLAVTPSDGLSGNSRRVRGAFTQPTQEASHRPLKTPPRRTRALQRTLWVRC